MGGGKQLKVPELDPKPDMQNFRTARNSSCLSTGKAMNKLIEKTGILPGPIRGVSGLAMNSTKNSRDSKMMMTFLNQSLNKFDHNLDIE